MNYYGYICIKTRLVHNMLSLFHKLYLDINNKFKLMIFDIHLIFFQNSKLQLLIKSNHYLIEK